MTNSQESDARKLPLSVRYVVESYPDEEEPIEEPTEHLTLSPFGIQHVSVKVEPIDDEPIEDELIEDEPIEDEPIEDEPMKDESMRDEPREDEPMEDEPLEDAAKEPLEIKTNGLVYHNGDEEELAGTKRKREFVAMINEAFEAKVEILNEHDDRLEDLKITKDTLENIDGELQKMGSELDAIHKATRTKRWQRRKMTNSQESDARKLPLSVRYVVESYPDEEEPIEEPTEHLTLSPFGIQHVSVKVEPIDDEPIEDELIEDEPIEDEPIEDEPMKDESMRDEPREDEPMEDEPLEDAAKEPLEIKTNGLVYHNGDEEELAGTKRKREFVAMINEAFEAKVEILNEHDDRLEDLKITKDTLENIDGELQKMGSELDAIHKATRTKRWQRRQRKGPNLLRSYASVKPMTKRMRRTLMRGRPMIKKSSRITIQVIVGGPD
nr:hypothetical protein [Tanacetum cinerariifolium]